MGKTIKELFVLFFLLICVLCSSTMFAQKQTVKPGSNLIRIGNCTYSKIGNISAFNEGLQFQNKQQYDLAIQKYVRSLNNVFKCNYKSYNNYGVCNSLIGDFRQADSLLNLSLKIGKNCLDCIYSSDMTYYNKFLNKVSWGADTAAFAMLKNLSENYVNKYPLPVGYTYYTNNRPNDAIEYFKLAQSKLSKEDLNDKALVSTLHYNLSLAELKIGDINSADKDIIVSLEKNNSDYDAWLLKGLVYSHLAKEPALNSFKKAVSAKFNYLTSYDIAIHYLRTGNYDKAHQSFAKIFSDSKEESDSACFGIAASAMREKNYDQSKIYFDLLYKIKSGKFSNIQLVEKGALFINSGEFSVAKETFNTLLKESPPWNYYAMIGLAIIDYLNGNEPAAKKWFSSLEGIAGTTYYNYCTATIRNICFEEMQEPYTAISVDTLIGMDYEEKYRLFKLITNCYQNLMTGNITLAYQEALAAYEISKGESQVLLLKGYSEFLFSKNDEAIKSLKEYCKVTDTGTDGYRILSLVYINENDFEKAIEQMDIALKKTKIEQDKLYNIYGLIYSHWSTSENKNFTKNIRDSLFTLSKGYFEKAYSINPLYVYIFNRGTNCASNKDSVDARKVFSGIMNWSWTNNNIAVMEHQMSSQADARRSIQKAKEIEVKFPSQATPLINQNHDIIVSGLPGTPRYIYCYNSFPKYRFTPIEILTPFEYLEPPLHQFKPEFESYDALDY